MRKAFKATWDDSSESKMEDEQSKDLNLCFMALEDNNEVPSTSHSFYDNYDNCGDLCDYDSDDDDDKDENSIVHKLMIKCSILYSKKKFYKQEFSKMSKEFNALKDRFSKVVSLNEKLENELKNSTSVQYKLDKCKFENERFLKEISDLKSSISKFQKGKETLDSILNSQKLHKDTSGFDYARNTPSSSSSPIFIKAKMNTTHASTSGTKTLLSLIKESHFSSVSIDVL